MEATELLPKGRGLPILRLAQGPLSWPSGRALPSTTSLHRSGQPSLWGGARGWHSLPGPAPLTAQP